MTGAEDRDVMQRWVAAIDELMTSLSNLVRVRQRAKPIEPILTDTEEAIARGNLRLMLQQASNAVLRERQPVYQASLMSAEQWIMDYFSDTKITRQVRERLQMLQSAQIVQKLPKIDATVNALDAFIIMRQRRLIQDLNEEDSLPRDRIGI
jgi:uroporphyrin-3 C-methyltransferase